MVAFAALVLAAFAQPMIEASPRNIICVVMIVVVSVAVGIYALRGKLFAEVPISTLQVLAVTGTMLACPLLFVTAEGNPTGFNLETPVLTFAYSALTVLTIVLAHIAYRKMPFISRLRAAVVERHFEALGVFRPLPSSHLWLLGIVGWGAMFYIYLFLPDRGVTAEGSLDKLVQALVPFVFAPLLLPFAQITGGTTRLTGGDWLKLAAYMGSILFLAIGRNSRGVFASPVLLVGLAILLGGLLGHYRVRLLSLRTISLLLVLGVASTALADLALAMQIVRSARGQVSSRELAAMSVSMLFDRKQLRDYRAELYSHGSGGGTWEEYYVSNPFLSRFANPKFMDNVIVLSQYLGPADRAEYFKVSMRKMAATLPDPLFRLLQLDIDKRSINSYSSGDYIYYLVTGTGLGDMRGGSFVGGGFFLFSWGFPPVMFVAALGLFFVGDILAKKVQLGGAVGRSGGAIMLVSPFALMSSMSLLFIFECESIMDYPSLLLRGILQSLVLYLVITKVCNVLLPRR